MGRLAEIGRLRRAQLAWAGRKRRRFFSYHWKLPVQRVCLRAVTPTAAPETLKREPV